jgi:hypothetical protein
MRVTLSHQLPSGDLAVVLERALDALLPQLRRQRFAQRLRPRREKGPRKESSAGEAERAAVLARAKQSSSGRRRSRSIPAEVKRQVAQRDGYRCTFVDPAYLSPVRAALVSAVSSRAALGAGREQRGG